MIFETERLYVREMEQSDLQSLKKMLQDPEVMYAYEHTFDDEKTQKWLDRQRKRYEDEGLGLWAVILKETGEMIGQSGISMQKWGDIRVQEIGYLFQKEYWHNGYATEIAKGCKKYAFEVLDYDIVYSIIKYNNYTSQNVAMRNGMKKIDEFVKHYNNTDMLHYVYGITREEYEKESEN